MVAAHPGIEWLVMDIRALDFADMSFGACIDKATLDAMLYGSLWDPEDQVRDNVKRYVDEVSCGVAVLLLRLGKECGRALRDKIGLRITKHIYQYIWDSGLWRDKRMRKNMQTTLIRAEDRRWTRRKLDRMNAIRNVLTASKQIARVLKPGGVWLYITWRQPHFIRPLIQRPEVWSVEVETLADEPGGGGMFEYFGFVMRKKEGKCVKA